ncbi:hypothetical protein ACSBR1_030793 [Camellia fascicularis]
MVRDKREMILYKKQGFLLPFFCWHRLFLRTLSMSGEEEENAAELKIGDDFLKAKCLMNCEVSLILEHKYEQLQQMADDPMNQVSQVFEKSLQYVKRFSRYKNPDSVKQAREYPLINENIATLFLFCVNIFCISL